MEKMLNNRTNLHNSWSNYKSSLPVREYTTNLTSEYLPLSDIMYVMRIYNIIFRRTSYNREQNRWEVKNIAAPPSYGKTSSILPAFLKVPCIQQQ